MLKISTRKKLELIMISGLAYFLMDFSVQMTEMLPSFAGIKNFLPFSLGLFFGPYGVIGCVMGCVLSSLIVNPNINAVIYECLCITITGLGMFYGWHILSKSHRISFKTLRDLARYIFLLLATSLLCCDLRVSAAYFLTGLFIGITVNILFSSILYVEPVIPHWCSYEYDSVFSITSEANSLEDANKILEASAEKYNISMKRIFELQSCIEELTIRIFNANQEAKIFVRILYGEAISARLAWPGKKYNPLMIQPDEDEIDVISLKIIKRRALRASFSYTDGQNKIHVVI